MASFDLAGVNVRACENVFIRNDREGSACYVTARDYQGKRVNPPYRPNQRNPSKAIPSSSAHITRALHGCFRAGSVYVSLHFFSKQSKTSNAVEMSSFN